MQKLFPTVFLPSEKPPVITVKISRQRSHVATDKGRLKTPLDQASQNWTLPLYDQRS